MSSDTVYQQLRSDLAALKLEAIADRLAPALEAAEHDKPTYTRFLAELIGEEVTADRERRLQARLRFAKLPAQKTLEQFDFDAQPGLDRHLVQELATLRFVEEKANALLIGPPGVGKTHLAIALAHKAIHAGYRVYYTTAADLVARTEKAALEGRWASTMRFWNGPAVLVVDELGYLPMPGEAASHLFQVINRRYENGSIVLTTNRGIADWGEIFEDTTVATAILDRLLHHATVITIAGDSYRMRSHRDALKTARAALSGARRGGEFPFPEVGNSHSP
jgi:DNA replication protein DnaC